MNRLNNSGDKVLPCAVPQSILTWAELLPSTVMDMLACSYMALIRSRSGTPSFSRTAQSCACPAALKALR